jgi:diguanylate cyclase (GGDEF)-like protein
LLELVLREHQPLWANLRYPPESPRGDDRERTARPGAHAAVPLLSGARAVAALSLVAEEAGFFEDVGDKLLADLMGDLSLALDHLARKERLEFLALHDVLTGLPNRSSFLERVARQIESVTDERPQVAIAVVDIERFSRINDTLGRQDADALLREVAERLSRRAGERFAVARVGGDSFAISAPRRWTPEALLQAHRRIYEAVFGEPFRVGGEELRLTVRTGVACYPADAKEPEQLFANAEAALLQAKTRAQRLVFYSPEMNELAAATLRLEAKLRGAIERDEFRLWYQPTVDVTSRRVVGLEALLRWQSPDRGLLPPAEFLPVLEQTGLIVEAGAWVLERALADAAALRERGLEVPRIAVNVSALELRQVGFLDQVVRILEGARVQPVCLELEVTESAVMENLPATSAKLAALRAKGIHITMDDFGTGYSSLGPLSQLPVMSLKIDRSFVQDMERPESLSIVKAIVSMGHSLGLQVVAEGVETEEQARQLARLRCDRMQGYLISRPVPFEEATKLLGPRGAL